jgi:hypothetical protein
MSGGARRQNVAESNYGTAPPQVDGEPVRGLTYRQTLEKVKMTTRPAVRRPAAHFHRAGPHYATWPSVLTEHP